MRANELRLADNCFNSRSREGSDGIIAVGFELLRLFQLTLPRRERLLGKAPDKPISPFQLALPRRERCVAADFEMANIRMFQLALPRRERLIAFTVKSQHWAVSTRAPAKEATTEAAK